MSDLSPQLQQASSQLSVSSYFDEALFQRESSGIFTRGPRYVGHHLSVPHLGDYAALPHEAAGRALVHTQAGVELISNVCRHRQSLLLKGRGSLNAGTSSGNIVCPLHHWTYSANSPSSIDGGPGSLKTGTLIGAPHFAQDPCLNLNNYPLQSWNGLLFEKNPDSRNVALDLAHIGPLADLDFSGHVLDRVEMHECNYNWKTFIEVYLEDYHVGPFHPGLGSMVSCDDLRWEFKEHYSVQTVGVANRLGRADATGGSPVPPKYGAIWLTCYPGVMVEWYPHVLTVSTLHPIGPQKTMNMVEFYYPEEIHAFEREFVEAQQAAYMETCVEDDEIALRMDAGRRALMQRGDNEFGPYQSPMEDGMQHFHEWYRRQMGARPLA